MRSSGPRGQAMVFPDALSARGRLTRRYMPLVCSVAAFQKLFYAARPDFCCPCKSTSRASCLPLRRAAQSRHREARGLGSPATFSMHRNGQLTLSGCSNWASPRDARSGKGALEFSIQFTKRVSDVSRGPRKAFKAESGRVCTGGT